MGGNLRCLHGAFFPRYVFGLMATWQVANFLAEQSYGIARIKNPDIMWPWWLDLMYRKRAGEVPDVPGYMYAKFRNDAENRWAEKYNFPEGEILEARENQGDSQEHYTQKRRFSTGLYVPENAA